MCNDVASKWSFLSGHNQVESKILSKLNYNTPSEEQTPPRGTHQISVNNIHQMLAIWWLDSKPLHFISTLDLSEIVKVQRKLGPDKLDVSAPMAVANYDNYMGDVDRHDRLCLIFSLCK